MLGLSRGGSVAATLAGTVPGVAALVSWSGAIYDGYDEDPDGHQVARENGVSASDVPPDAVPPAAEPSATRRAFAEPRVETFSDLQDLFLVDPIHDVDEAGWPHAKP